MGGRSSRDVRKTQPSTSSNEAAFTVLVCRKCQVELAKPVVIDRIRKTFADFAAIDPRRAGDPSAVPTGAGATVRMELWTGHFNGEGERIEEDRIWLNLADVNSEVQLDRKLGFGCCGPSGQINRRCSCGALVGREYSDCLRAHYFSPEPTQTEWVAFIEDEVANDAARAQRFADASRQAKRDRAHHNKKPSK